MQNPSEWIVNIKSNSKSSIYLQLIHEGRGGIHSRADSLLRSRRSRQNEIHFYIHFLFCDFLLFCFVYGVFSFILIWWRFFKSLNIKSGSYVSGEILRGVGGGKYVIYCIKF